MNPRHAAALALVGWYLMTPPYAVDSAGRAIPGTINTKAQLSDWLAYNHVFDSLGECDKERRANPSFFKDDPVRYQANKTALCVRTDDPRLPK
jgi:hypothetical protein